MRSKEESEAFNQIIGDSKRKLLVLQLLSHFFNHSDLVAILIRTRVIHSIFESNENLDVNKLDLFHIQFTDSLIALLQKIKKTQEQKYLLIEDEININKEYISKIQSDLKNSTFNEDVKLHTKNISDKIASLYKMLAFDKVLAFSWKDVTAFSDTKSQEFYREISTERYTQLTKTDCDKTYQNEFVTIEKKLLGRLNIQQFKIKFLCGFRCANKIAEIFEFFNSNDLFIFIIESKSFYLLDPLQLNGLDLSKNVSTIKSVADQLILKNSTLEEQLNAVNFLPLEVEKVLMAYKTKISDVDFFNDLQNVDEQTNILKAMLNINIK